LQDKGGWLHIHENVKDSELEAWVEKTVDEISRIAVALERSWKVSKHHLERVKWCVGPPETRPIFTPGLFAASAIICR
jgi:hypothetical protein